MMFNKRKKQGKTSRLALLVGVLCALVIIDILVRTFRGPDEAAISAATDKRASDLALLRKKSRARVQDIQVENDVSNEDAVERGYRGGAGDGSDGMVQGAPHGHVRVTLPGTNYTVEEGVNFNAQYDVRKVPQDLSGLFQNDETRRIFEYPARNPDYPYIVVSHSPVILFFPKVLSSEEADHLVDRAQSSLFRSQVANKGTSGDSGLSDVRTSSQTWLDPDDEVLKRVFARLAGIIGIPEHEKLQILRYKYGQKYSAHHDYFDPGLYGPQTSNRAATFYLYLNDVAEGGETYFPRANGGMGTADHDDCESHGLRVHPCKGCAAVFYDMRPDGRLDPYSLHGSCAVRGSAETVKWGGTLWFRVDTTGASSDYTAEGMGVTY